MLVTRDRLPHPCARACHGIPLNSVLPASATLRQIGKCPVGPAKASQWPTVPQRLAVSRRPEMSGLPSGSWRPAVFRRPPVPSVVTPRPGGRGICFSSAHAPHASLIFSTLRTLCPARKPQPTHCHRLTHSLLVAKVITRAFPIGSRFFRRFVAPERNVTPLFACACALFRKNTRGGGMQYLNSNLSRARHPIPSYNEALC